MERPSEKGSAHWIAIRGFMGEFDGGEALRSRSVGEGGVCHEA